MNLLFTSDRNYYIHVVEVLRSIQDYHNDLDVYLISNDIGDEDLKKYNEYIKDTTRIHIVRFDDCKLDGAKVSKRYPKVIYYRLLAGDFLPQEIGKILYLDPDIIVKGSLDELYNIDLGDNLFAGATNIHEGLLRFNQIKNGAKKENLYINTGVVLMNVKEMRKAIVASDVYKYIEKYKNVLTLPDQDVINALYGDRILIFDNFKYNLSDRTIKLYNLKIKNFDSKIDLDWVEKNCTIIHYFGRNKPWRDTYKGILRDYYLKYQIVK